MGNVRGNVSNQPGARIYPTTREEQLDAYDAMPLRWRELVGSLPIPQDTRTLSQVLEQMGERRGYDYVVAQFRVAFPGWTPP